MSLIPQEQITGRGRPFCFLAGAAGITGAAHMEMAWMRRTTLPLLALPAGEAALISNRAFAVRG